MSYKGYYYSNERQAGRGLMAVALGVAACCVPGGQGVGAAAILGGLSKFRKYAKRLK